MLALEWIFIQKVFLRLEKKTNTMLCVLFKHTARITLQKDLTMQEVAVTGLFQVIHQQIPLNPSSIH